MFKQDEYKALSVNEQFKEFYAYMGLTMSNLQNLEYRLLTILLLLNRADNFDMTPEEYSNRFYASCEQEPEKLCLKMVETCMMSEEDGNKLKYLFKKRAFIVHRLLRENSYKICRVEGRIELIEELENYSRLACELEKSLEEYTNIISCKIGKYKSRLDEWSKYLYIKGQKSKRFVF